MNARDEVVAEVLRGKYEVLSPHLDERARRMWGATEASALGTGGTAIVVAATGLSRSTVERGLRELREPERQADPGLIRRPGGGRKPIAEKCPQILVDLERLVDPVTRGDPESPLRWTSKSAAKLTLALRELGHEVGERTVSKLLHDLGYSLQANAKTREGKADHPDRDAQFQHIAEEALAFQTRGQPVISVDTKKKELVGDYKNAGAEWEKKGEPREVLTHDFPDPEVGKGIPYGVYDCGRNEGWVSVGVDHDTAEFAVATIRTWWRQMGRKAYPEAGELLITADSGGSNSARSRLWKKELQALSDAEGLEITVCHFPPGTSKWNKIEHRMFAEITKNWRARPLESHEVMVSLIGNTRTATGLVIQSKIDQRRYDKGKKVSPQEFSKLNLSPSSFHGEWNYKVSPRVASDSS